MFEIFCVGGREDRTPRLDVVDVEFLRDVRREVFYVDRRARPLVALLVGPGDYVAKRVRGDGNALARLRGKVQLGPRSCRDDGLQPRPQQRADRGGGGLRKKASSCREPQNRDSLAESDRRRYEEGELHEEIASPRQL